MSYPIKQTNTQEDFETEDAKTQMVEKTLTRNQFTNPDDYNSMVAHNGIDPMTECTTYYPSPEYIQDRVRKLHNQNRLKEFATPARIRPYSTHQQHLSEENFIEPLMLKGLQGFSTRAVTGPAIRSSVTNSEGILGQAPKKGLLQRMKGQ